jgi:hypothetical protein
MKSQEEEMDRDRLERFAILGDDQAAQELKRELVRHNEWDELCTTATKLSSTHHYQSFRTIVNSLIAMHHGFFCDWLVTLKEHQCRNILTLATEHCDDSMLIAFMLYGEPRATLKHLHSPLGMKHPRRSDVIAMLNGYLSLLPEKYQDSTCVRQIRRGFGLGAEFSTILPGVFWMGSPENELGRHDDEIHHQVALTRPFQVSRTQLTQREYERVMGNNPSEFSGRPDSPMRPVECVSWNDSIDYCNARSEMEGLSLAYVDGQFDFDVEGYRLLTEAEWEYAARAGTTGPRYHDDLDAIAWYGANSEGETHPVGQKLPNDWELYDGLGNVWEWTADGYAPYTSNCTDEEWDECIDVLKIWTEAVASETYQPTPVAA